MVDKCPTCDRSFERISDYPLVYVRTFVRLSIPSEIVFPDYGPEAFVGPASRCINKRPPQEVLEFFKGNKRSKEFEHEGYTWNKIDGKWDSGSYRRSTKDAKKTILAQITPYFDHLESLVGKEVPTSEVLPKFGGSRYNYLMIPDTTYNLELEEMSDEFYAQMFKQNNLPIQNLETLQSTRKLAFFITHCEGGGISQVHSLANVGGLAYEGRIRKR